MPGSRFVLSSFLGAGKDCVTFIDAIFLLILLRSKIQVSSSKHFSFGAEMTVLMYRNPPTSSSNVLRDLGNFALCGSNGCDEDRTICGHVCTSFSDGANVST